MYLTSKMDDRGFNIDKQRVESGERNWLTWHLRKIIERGAADLGWLCILSTLVTMKEKEKMVVRVTKLVSHQEHSHGAVISKSQTCR